MISYYNEIDAYAAQWLRNLITAGHIAPGDVDERSIVDVRPDDLAGYIQCHFFAGIGVWSHSLRQAGWPDDRPVWTGSCPCQPFSSASGRNDRRQDDRYLWPQGGGLIAECAPRTIFGEQVASAGDWFDEVCNDLEAMGYAVGASIFPAVAVGCDHARSRLYFVGHTHGDSEPRLPIDAKVAGMSRHYGNAATVVRPHGHPARVAQLRAIGNAICAPQAQAFIEAAMKSFR